MAKKKPATKKTKFPKLPKLNKSDLIRTHKAEHPDHSPKMIAEALTNQGYSVSAQFVSTVLSNAKRSGGKVEKRGPKAKAKTVKFEGSKPGRDESLLDTVLAIKLMKQLDEVLDRLDIGIDELYNATHGE